MQPAPYTRLAHHGESLFKDRASKFYAHAFPCHTMEEFETQLAELKKAHPKARHFCWAARWGNPLEERSNDGGEPAHSAGTPILHALQSAQLEQSAAVVIRYFGGTKLGVSGLIHAYKTATLEAILQAGQVEMIPKVSLHCTLPYSALGALESIARLCNGSLHSQDFGVECRLVMEVPWDEWPRCEVSLREQSHILWTRQAGFSSSTT